MKTTVQIDGKPVEVDIPGVVAEADIAAKYMPKDVFESELTRRGTSIAETQGYVNPRKLDDAGRKKLIADLGLEIVTDEGDGAGAGGDIGSRLQQARGEWAQQELEPVLLREKAKDTEIETLRRDRLTDSIVAAAARAGVKAVLLNPPAAGAKAPIVAMLEQAFSFDGKTRQWYAKGESGFAFAAQPTGERPYKTVEEFLGDWARQPTSKEFIGVQTQSGPGLQGGGGQGGSGVGFISRADARNPIKYRAAKEAAAKQGVQLQYSD